MATACTGLPSVFSASEPEQAASPLAALQATIGTPRCEQNAQCHTVAVGHRACGGPERYLPWSDAVSQASKVQQAAQAYAAERRAENQKTGQVSICVMVTDPGARCDAASQRCVLAVGGGSAGAQAR